MQHACVGRQNVSRDQRRTRTGNGASDEPRPAPAAIGAYGRHEPRSATTTLASVEDRCLSTSDRHMVRMQVVVGIAEEQGVPVMAASRAKVSLANPTTAPPPQ